MRGLWNNKVIFWNFAVLVLLKLAAGPAFQYASLTDGGATFSAQEIIAGTNAYRTSQGMTPLKESIVLGVAAAQKLDDMVRNQYFAHFSPGGVSPWYWFQINGYAYSYAGENLAIGYSDAQATVDAWIRSPTHRNNIISSSFKEIGVATAAVTINGDRGVLVVQLFGAPAAKPSVAGESKQGIELSLSQSEASQEEPAPAVVRSEPEVVRQVQSSPRAARSTSIRDVQPSKGVRFLNQSFIVYAFIVSLVALGYLWTREFRKQFVYKTALHILVFLLAVFVPVMTALQTARIQ